MTEAKRTGEELMWLVNHLALVDTDRRKAQYSDLKARLTALCESRDKAERERDQAVKENVQYFSMVSQMRNSVTVVAAEFPNVAEYLKQVETQRDQLQAKCERLQNSFKDIWQIKYRDSAQLSMIACYYCGKKHPEIEKPFEHAPDCIIRTLDESPSPR